MKKFDLEHAVGYRSPTSITVRTIISGEGMETISKDRVLHMTYEEFAKSYKEWNKGRPIQDAFPKLTADDREHLQSAGVFSELFPEYDN